MDIRSREVKTNVKNIDKAELFIRVYNGIESTEYFISYESPDQAIPFMDFRSISSIIIMII